MNADVSARGPRFRSVGATGGDWQVSDKPKRTYIRSYIGPIGLKMAVFGLRGGMVVLLFVSAGLDGALFLFFDAPVF